MEGYTYFFTYEETLPHRIREFWQLPCALGMDASQGDDFWAFTFLVSVGWRSLRSQDAKLHNRANVHAAAIGYAAEVRGVHPRGKPACDGRYGAELGMEIYDDLDAFVITSEYDVRCFGYDPYNAKEFLARWEAENGPFGITKVIQGAKTESVPLGELKKLSEDRHLIFDQSLMSFAMGNAITLEDTNGNRKLLEEASGGENRQRGGHDGRLHRVQSQSGGL
jgi:phage terminase large subunit-like protein